MKKSDQIPPDDLLRINDTIESLQIRIEDLESRIARFEASPLRRYLAETDEDKGEETVDDDSKGVESTIGEHGFAWLSSIILMLFVIFLMVLVQKSSGSLSATLIGLAATGGVYLLTLFLRRRFSGQVHRIHTGILILLYYIALRLHFFGEDPLIQSLPAGILILTVPVVIQFVYASKRQSQFLTGIGYIMLITAALFSDSTAIIMAAGFAAAVISVFLLWKNNWSQQLYFALFLVYLNHLLWLFGNPVAGHLFVMREFPGINLLLLFSYGILFSAGSNLLYRKEQPASFSISATICNALCFSLLLALVITGFYKTNHMLIFALISLLSLGYSVLMKIMGKHPFITSFYACVSFIAISITIYGYAGLPQSFLWLALQSLLVLIVALWFSSKIIVWVNTVLFVSMLIFYLVKSPSLDSVNVTFALVALLSARFLNWKKERLKIETEVMRNIFLVAAFFMTLLALYRLVPKEFITLSWVGAAALYFVLSILIRNVKYRYLAIGILTVSVFYLFLIDLKNMDIGFRVVALLIIALISLFGSLYYTSRKTRFNSDRDKTF